MKPLLAILVAVAVAGLAACATTRYQPFEAKENIFEGRGGTRTVVNGVDVWDNGAPPRRFKVLGIIDDRRSDGIIPESTLLPDVVKLARKEGGDAVVRLGSSARTTGYYTIGPASSSSFTMPDHVNMTKFAVIKYLH